MWNLSVSPILDFAIKKWASDIHITEGSFRVNAFFKLGKSH
jgi:hypothetical protein